MLLIVPEACPANAAIDDTAKRAAALAAIINFFIFVLLHRGCAIAFARRRHPLNAGDSIPKLGLFRGTVKRYFWGRNAGDPPQSVVAVTPTA